MGDKKMFFKIVAKIESNKIQFNEYLDKSTQDKDTNFLCIITYDNKF